MFPVRLFVPASLVLSVAACGGAQEPTGPAEDAPSLSIQSHVAGDPGFRAASHLIVGQRDAILVDAQFTRSEARALARMVRQSGRELRAIVITHGHPDHHLGLEVLTREFPDARVLATPDVIADIKATAPARIAYWKPKMGDEVADNFVTPAALDGDTLDLEGAAIRIVSLGAGESEHTAVVYVPSLRALITGDVVFHDVHLWLAENHPDGWLKNLAAVREIGPIDRIYPGHGAAGDASLLDANAAYIRAFVAATDGAKDPASAAKKLTAQYPSWGLPIIAEISTAARQPAAAH